MKFPYKTFDLTHTLSSKTPSWEGDCGFNHELIWDYSSSTTSVKFRVQKLNMVAGIGTHIDAPAHCIPGGRTIDELGLDELIVPCVVIDVSKRATESYLVALDDIIAFEQSHGYIAAGCLVIIRTGWEQFWEQPEKYRNNLVFPSVNNEAAQYLLKRGIVGLGIDTLSPDRPDSGYPVHAALLGAGKYIIENVANSSMLPPTGSFVFVLPLKIKEGTEAPVRLIALIPDVTNC
jgi:kynurenine formamidase